MKLCAVRVFVLAVLLFSPIVALAVDAKLCGQSYFSSQDNQRLGW